MKTKLDPKCEAYRAKKLGARTGNGSIVTKIIFDSESRQKGNKGK